MADPVSDSIAQQPAFMPHGHCYFWQPEILWVHVISDALIALAYASIPAALIYFVIKRTDLRFSWIFVLFGIFILACGATHVMNVYNTWYPAYYAAGVLKIITASASIGTAIVLWPLVPVLLRIPSPEQLENANLSLATEVEEHKLAREELSAQAQELELQAQQLELVNVQLEASNKHLEEFTSAVAHDLQEPLRKVITFGDMLKRSIGDDLESKPRDRLERMVGASLRMQSLIDNLLTYAQITHRDPEYTEVNLEEVVQEVLLNLEYRTERTKGEIRVEGTLPTIEADRSHMVQLFQNFISNGLKFHRPDTPPVITLRTEAVTDCPHFDGPGWKFSISDNGIGIPETKLERIFGAFERLHSRAEFEGTGIGLSVCKGAVERHHGGIRASSKLGEGSLFEFWLPERQTGKSLEA